MNNYHVHTDFRTSKYRRSHVLVNESESETIWCRTFGEVLARLIDKGQDRAIIIDEGDEYEITFRVHEKLGQ